MLKTLYIRNFAIIDELELELHSGMTALTGETGAGKSILLGALSLVLGDRADNGSIKTGCDFAEVVAEFNIDNLPNVCSWLVEQELNSEQECIIRRRITRDGRSRATINSTPVNLQLIRELAEMLIDIHGQHEHQSMMKNSIQRQLLDDCANHKPLLEAVSNLYVELKLLEEQLHHLQISSKEKNDRLDLLRFQTSEMDALSLEQDEYTQLNEQHKRLANAEKIISSVEQALQLLSEDENNNIQSSLSRILNTLSEIADVDMNLKNVTEILGEAQVQIDESVSLLQNFGDEIELNPADLDEVEQRLQLILDLSRKHRVEPEGLHELHESLQNELDDIDHADERLTELTKEKNRLEDQYLQTCNKLTSSRKKAASRLNKSITKSMQTLGMSGGEFKIEISPLKDNRSASGLDKIEFTVTANAGQQCRPVSRVASGGELARISLAVQMIIANSSRIPSLIFDEVDSGIGGGIAEIVGQHLRTLGSNSENLSTQVICITHLPQVASQAHNHLRVEKLSKKQQTSSQVITLDDEQRRQEIARMLSGVEITDQSLQHADDMITRAQTN